MRSGAGAPALWAGACCPAGNVKRVTDSAASSLPHSREGRVRAIALRSARRVPRGWTAEVQPGFGSQPSPGAAGTAIAPPFGTSASP